MLVKVPPRDLADPLADASLALRIRLELVLGELHRQPQRVTRGDETGGEVGRDVAGTVEADNVATRAVLANLGILRRVLGIFGARVQRRLEEGLLA